MAKLSLTEAEKSQIYDMVESEVYRDAEDYGYEDKHGDEITDEQLTEQINSQYEQILEGGYGNRKALVESGYISSQAPKLKKKKGAKLM
jgi:hypothetical protein